MDKPYLKNKIYSNKGLFILSLIFLLSLVFYFSDEINFREEQSNKVESIISNDTNEQNISSNNLTLETSLPTKILIPRLNIQSDFDVPLDLNSNGEVEVPKDFSKVGWYKHSPAPGSLGPAVILGHVDSYKGPAVFFSLGQLEVGDDIYIEREDGKTAHFKVDFLERYEQKEFPTEQVYGNIDYAGLRLVTCSGIYLKGKQRYTHNLVVYARLVE